LSSHHFSDGDIAAENDEKWKDEDGDEDEMKKSGGA